MRKWVIVLGLVIIGAMCLIPPKKVRTVNALSKSESLQEFGAERNARLTLQYVPVWSEPKSGFARSAEGSTLATQRLMLQILVVAIVTAGVAALFGSGFVRAQNEKRGEESEGS